MKFNFLKIISSFAILSLSTPIFSINDGDILKLWPNFAPGSESLILKEEIIERSKTPDIIKDRAAVKTLNPSITAYIPKNPNGVAILIAPGGGYARTVLDKEADELAPWLKNQGISFFILKYRLPGDGHLNREVVPLQDAQRAMRIIRSNAVKWNLNPNKIGIMGFSAGGHLASTLTSKYNEKVYEEIDQIDSISAKPNFQILGYPVITMKDPFVHLGSRNNLLGENPSEELKIKFSSELNINADTPPTFIMHATDDKSVPVENSIEYYYSLRKNNIPVELHIFQDGGHGYSIRGTKGKTSEEWTSLVSKWLNVINIIPK